MNDFIIIVVMPLIAFGLIREIVLRKEEKDALRIETESCRRLRKLCGELGDFAAKLLKEGKYNNTVFKFNKLKQRLKDEGVLLK